MIKQLAFVLLSTGLLVQSVHAQLADSDSRIIEVSRVDKAPVLDGVLDDDAWVGAVSIEDLHEVKPNEYGPPSEKSIIYIVYTDEALYVAAIFRDSEADKISAQILRQGDFSFGEDSITVMLDPFNKGRSGYAFDLTPNAVRTQALYTNVIEENWNWNGIWHGETVIDDQGWTAEIEIPFKTLSFDPQSETWGLNIARYIGRKAEHLGWVSANRTQNPAVSGKMKGIKGAQQGFGLDVIPGIRIKQSKNFEDHTSDTEIVPAIDVFYKLTPALTAAVTINTDFSGTGADPRQINLTRFGLFFPERRGFFLQDSDIFEFGKIGGRDYRAKTTLSRVEQESGRPFFSRRLGLGAEGETIDINFGAKMTGRAGRWDIGMLAIQQDEFDDLDKSELFVARFAANVLAESSVGMILTHGDPNSALDNTVAGVDFRYLNTQLSDGGTLEGSMWYQQSETEGVKGDAAAYGFTLKKPSAEGLRYALGLKEIQENFFPALGFVNRTGIRDLTTEAGYTWYPESELFRTIYTGMDYERIETIGGDLQSQVITLRPLEISNPSRDQAVFHYSLVDEVLTEPFEISDGIVIPIGDYSFEQYCINAASAEFRKVSAEAYYCGGDFYHGSQDAAGAALLWRPSAHFKFSVSYDYYDIALPEGAFTTRLIGARADIAFNSAWYWENFVQYDNVSDSLGFNSILGWIPRAGRELILVVNREYMDYLEDRHFTAVSGDITFKTSYTFRF